MARTPDRFHELVSRRATQEINLDSAQIAKVLASELPDDVVDKGRQVYLDYFQRNYPSADWRTKELDRVGPHNFIHAAYAAFGLKEPDWRSVKFLPVGTGMGTPMGSDVGPTPEQMAAPTNTQAPTPSPVTQTQTQPTTTPVITPPDPGEVYQQ